MAHLVESRCKWVAKVTCKKEWPNCLVSKEKPCIRERQYLLIEDSTRVMKRIAAIFWVLLWARHSTRYFKSTSTLKVGYTERKMRCSLVWSHVPGHWARKQSGWVLTSGCPWLYSLTICTRGRKNVVRKSEGRGPQDILWVCFREKQMEAFEMEIKEVRIICLLLRTKGCNLCLSKVIPVQYSVFLCPEMFKIFFWGGFQRSLAGFIKLKTKISSQITVKYSELSYPWSKEIRTVKCVPHVFLCVYKYKS